MHAWTPLDNRRNPPIPESHFLESLHIFPNPFTALYRTVATPRAPPLNGAGNPLGKVLEQVWNVSDGIAVG